MTQQGVFIVTVLFTAGVDKFLHIALMFFLSSPPIQTCPHCHMPHDPHVRFSLLRGALRALLRDCTGGLAVRWQRDSVCEFPSICFLTSALQVRTVMLTPSTSSDRGSRNAMQRPQPWRHSCKRHSRDRRFRT